MNIAQFEGGPTPDTKKVWYAGTDTLRYGYVLCAAHDADPNASDPKLRLGTKYVQPTNDNLKCAPVIVADQQMKGPGFVTVIKPRKGDYVDAYVKANATAITTLLGPAHQSYNLEAVPITPATDTSGSPTAAEVDTGIVTGVTQGLNVIARAAVTGDTSSTAALKSVQLI